MEVETGILPLRSLSFAEHLFCEGFYFFGGECAWFQQQRQEIDYELCLAFTVRHSEQMAEHGPFSNTEINIYCDESRHEGQKHQPYMVIGGLWLQRAKRREILEGLRSIQAEHGLCGELKWTKLSQRHIDGYKAIIDFVALRSDVHFRCIVVDKSKVDADKYFHNDRQLGFWVFYWHCLKQWMGNGNTYFISIDFKPASLHSGPRRLKEILENECLSRAWVRSLECVDSKENLFCQIADLLIGAVGYSQNKLRGSEVKLAFCTHIAHAFDRSDLRGTDLPSKRKFNIFRIWS